MQHNKTAKTNIHTKDLLHTINKQKGETKQTQTNAIKLTKKEGYGGGHTNKKHNNKTTRIQTQQK